MEDAFLKHYDPRNRKFNPTALRKLFRTRLDDIDLTGKEYFLCFLDTIPSELLFDNLSANIKDQLTKKGWKAFNSSSYFKPSQSNTDHCVEYWTKGNLFLRCTFHSRGEKCVATLYYPFDLPKENLDGEIAFFQQFKDTAVKSKFHILIKDEYDLSLKEFNVKVPPSVNLELNYGEKFPETHQNIKHKLSTEDSGLFVFHGPPGCGKSTYIKKLAEEIPDKKFVYVPECMVGLLNDPSTISLFIENQNSVLVIEDAEKIIKNREEDDSSFVPIILNISDGILSDILKIPVILTYNTATSNIDRALLRKGRLKFKHEFGHLSTKDVVALLKHVGKTDKEINALKKDGKILENMSLADVYFLNDEVGAPVPTLPVKTAFGFGPSNENT